MSKIHKPWVSHEELDAFLGGGILDVFPHAADHEVGGGDLLAFADITGFGTYIDQALLQASSPLFANLYLEEHLYHAGDLDTYIKFQADQIFVRVGNVTFINMLEGATDYLQLLDGKNFIGDDLNAKMTVGLTINQAAADDEILAFKSSDVAHGMTGAGMTETDTYGLFAKDSGVTGGLAIKGWGSGVYGIDLQVYYTTDNAVKSAAGRAPFEVAVAKYDGGTSVGPQGADANLACFRSNGSTRWILDEDGDTWQPGIVTAQTFHLLAGVTPNLAWLSDVNLDVLEQGETLLYDADTGNFVDAWGVEYDNPRLVWKMYTEFMGYDAMSSPPWTGGTIAGGTKVGIAGLANHPGIMNFLSGITANSGYRYAIENDAILIAGKESTEFIFQMKTNNDTRVKCGFIDTYSSGNPVDGVWLEILGGVLTGKTANNTATSTTGTNFNIALNTWYRMKLFINNAMTLVTYRLYTCADDTIRWTDTLAANIPTARVTGHGIIATHSEEFVVNIIWVDMMTANRAGAWNR